jgi:hypothetical protein
VPSVVAKINELVQGWVPVIKEHTLSSIVLSAGDLLDSSSSSSSSSSFASTSSRQMTIQITKLPLNGVLYTTNTSSKSLVKINDIIKVMKKNQSSPQFETFYLGNANFFTSPNKTYDNSVIANSYPLGDFFQFRAVTGGFYSTVVTQRVTLLNVNNPSILDISQIASNPEVIDILNFVCLLIYTT